MEKVGTTKVFEDNRIIVWDFVLEPGEQTPVHTHNYDFVFYVIEGSPLEAFGANGISLFSFEPRIGDVFSFCIDADDLVSNDGKELRIARTHSARNTGSTRYREVLLEKKS